MADDEPHIGRIIKMKLEQGPFRVTLAYDGREALQVLESEPDIRLVLLDLMMPHMSGLEVQRHLVGTELRIPTIVYTADDAPEAEARYVAAGVTAYLRKPIAGDDLLAAIEQVMSRIQPTTGDQTPTVAPPS